MEAATISAVTVAVSLLGLMGSAIGYVINLFQQRREKRIGSFFELMKILDSTMPIATKMAATYQLREYPEHKDFISRFLRSQQGGITGAGAEQLQNEMNETLAFFDQR